MKRIDEQKLAPIANGLSIGHDCLLDGALLRKAQDYKKNMGK